MIPLIGTCQRPDSTRSLRGHPYIDLADASAGVADRCATIGGILRDPQTYGQMRQLRP